MGKIIAPALKWAFIGGLCSIILQTVLMLLSTSLFGGMWGILVYLPLLFCMIFGGISIRKDNSGSLGFGKSFLAVFIIAITGSLLYNFYVYEFWFKWIDPDFLNRAMTMAEEKLREAADKQGTSDEQIEMQLSFIKSINWEKWAFIIAGVFSVILSLIVAVFINRPDRGPTTQAEP